MRSVKFVSTSEWICLIASIIITFLFIFFAEPIIDGLYPGEDGFYETMYDTHMYSIVAIIASVVIWASCILYYIAFDSTHLDKFFKWLIWGVITIGIIFCLTYFYPLDIFSEIIEGDESASEIYGINILFMSLIMLPIEFILYFIVSIGTKNFSNNCGTRPF